MLGFSFVLSVVAHARFVTSVQSVDKLCALAASFVDAFLDVFDAIATNAFVSHRRSHENRSATRFARRRSFLSNGSF